MSNAVLQTPGVGLTVILKEKTATGELLAFEPTVEVWSGLVVCWNSSAAGVVKL